jgi:dTDP-4-dehydrorhamnose 3,5-epimerase
VLSANNHKTLIIPEGFAHGFQTLTENCEMLYFHTATYQPGVEAGLNARDPRLAIQWPLPILGLSPRDTAHPFLEKNFIGIAK